MNGDIYTPFRLKKNKSRPIRIGNNDRDFAIQQLSNDDPGMEKFLSDIRERWDQLEGIIDDLLAAFCPNCDNEHNDGATILRSDAFRHFDEIHLILLVQKWGSTRNLDVARIRNHFREIEKLQFHEVHSQGEDRKVEVKRILESIYR
ncbi:MAG: hypothetical protein ABSC53_09785 [Bacteroidota bacterium]